MLRFAGAGVSDVGRVRPHNEDSAFVGPYVALVADGVGGAAAGEVASATTAYVVAASALSRFGRPLEKLLTDAVDAARRSLQHGVLDDPERAGMATTLTAVVCDGRRVLLGHVGDSRAYLLSAEGLRQVSTDHTYVQHLVETGQLDRAGVARHPWRNVVLRSLDGDPESRVGRHDRVPPEVQAGARQRRGSPGLSHLGDGERRAAALGVADPRSAAAVLTHAALDAGGRDNVTCVVLDVVEGPLVVGDGEPLGAVRDLANIVDPAAVRLG